jgi:phenylalanine ammonia-lyase
VADSSLALISARATVTSLDVLSMLIASYLYLLCQGIMLFASILFFLPLTEFSLALDLRALRLEFIQNFKVIVEEQVACTFGTFISPSQQTTLSSELFTIMQQTFDKTTVMDSADQMRAVADSSSSAIVDFLCSTEPPDDADSFPSLAVVIEFRSFVSMQAISLHENLRKSFLSGAAGHAPASPYLGRTKRLYEFVREGLGIRMHGSENFKSFPNGIGVDEVSIGQNISKIYEVRCDLSYYQCTLLTRPFRLCAMVKCRMLSFRCLFELST